jgi:hypothetical protein
MEIIPRPIAKWMDTELAAKIATEQLRGWSCSGES